LLFLQSGYYSSGAKTQYPVWSHSLDFGHYVRGWFFVFCEIKEWKWFFGLEKHKWKAIDFFGLKVQNERI
jgi:hypothetical protein